MVSPEHDGISCLYRIYGIIFPAPATEADPVLLTSVPMTYQLWNSGQLASSSPASSHHLKIEDSLRIFLRRSPMGLRRLTVTAEVRSQQMLGAGSVGTIMPAPPLSACDAQVGFIR